MSRLPPVRGWLSRWVVLQNSDEYGEWNGTTRRIWGEGQVFDVTRPISEGLSTRPRRFKDIPGAATFCFLCRRGVESSRKKA